LAVWLFGCSFGSGFAGLWNDFVFQLLFFPNNAHMCATKKALLGRNEMGGVGGGIAHAILEPLTTNSPQRG
jgi:hypothetical protein